MASIPAKHTKPELSLRQAIHSLGYRYRLHPNNLPGRPDLVFPKHRAVVFVHGCFWHRHAGCKHAASPATRSEFWKGKFESNVSRDAAKSLALRAAGWRVAIVWECALRTKADMERTANSLAGWLKSTVPEFEIGRVD